MSGSSINEWSYSNVSLHSTRLVGEHLGCSIENALQLKECLQEKSIDELHDAVKEIVGFSLFDIEEFLDQF
jgi:hypothetical protein